MNHKKISVNLRLKEENLRLKKLEVFLTAMNQTI